MFRKTIVLSVLFCLVATAGAFAQGNDAQSQGAPVSKEGNVSFDFRDADIRNVFRILFVSSPQWLWKLRSVVAIIALISASGISSRGTKVLFSSKYSCIIFRSAE